MVAFSCTKTPQALTLMLLGSAGVIDASSNTKEVLTLQGKQERTAPSRPTMVDLPTYATQVIPVTPDNSCGDTGGPVSASYSSSNQKSHSAEIGITDNDNVISIVGASKRICDNRSFFEKHANACLLTGTAVTIGGTAWAFERLSEAMIDLNDPTKGGSVDPIDVEFVFAFSFIILLGTCLITHVMFEKFAPNAGKWSWLGMVGTGAAAVTFSLGFYYMSTTNSADAITLWSISVCLFLVVVVGFLVAKRGQGEGLNPLAIAGHIVGFASLVGGVGLFSYSFPEELADGIGSDNLGAEAALIWCAWMFGFAWLIKAFLIKRENPSGVLTWQNGCVLAAAGVTAGFLVGGFECVCNSGFSSGGAIACFSLAGISILLIILCKFFAKKISCLRGIAKRF